MALQKQQLHCGNADSTATPESVHAVRVNSVKEFIHVFCEKDEDVQEGSDTGKIFHIKTILKGTL